MRFLCCQAQVRMGGLGIRNLFKRGTQNSCHLTTHSFVVLCLHSINLGFENRMKMVSSVGISSSSIRGKNQEMRGFHLCWRQEAGNHTAQASQSSVASLRGNCSLCVLNFST